MNPNPDTEYGEFVLWCGLCLVVGAIAALVGGWPEGSICLVLGMGLAWLGP